MALPCSNLESETEVVSQNACDALEKERLLRQRIEEAAQEWQGAFDASEAAIFVFSSTQALRRLNRAALSLLGGIYQDHLGKRLTDFGGNELWREIGRALDEIRETQRSRRWHCTLDDQTWALTATLIPAAEPGRERFLVMLKDVTSLIELQDSLRRSELLSTMGALVAGVAHEVRNPLFGFSIGLDALARLVPENPEVEAEIGVLRLHLARLRSLTRELLEYGKPACRKLARIDVAELVERAVGSSEPMAQDFGVKVLRQMPAELPPVWGDGERLEAVFGNLIENALQHSPSPGTVVIRGSAVELSGRSAVRSVIEDSGEGFSAGDLAQVFEPFFSRRRGGTGLGLSIVRRVVEGHGGRVLAENRPEGGAILTVDLPCVPIATPSP